MHAHRTPAAAGARVDWLPLVTVALGFVMAMLDVTVVNVALGDIRADLSAALSTLVWVVDGYTLSFASLLLAGGALANRFGARAVYVAGLALFVVASILCGAAPGAGALVAARLLQGCAAALFIPSSLGLLTLAYPDHALRARMLGLWAAVVSLSAASGPLVGGVVVTWLGWRAIFLLNVPIGLAGIWLARRHLVATSGRPQALNLAAHACAAAGLGALAYALIEGPALGWRSPAVLATAAACVVAGLRFVALERRAAEPVVPRALLRDPRFLRMNGVGIHVNFGAFGTLFLASLYEQQARHAGPLATGVALLPLMVTFALGNLAFSRVSARVGAALPMRAGLALAAAATGTLALAACSGADLGRAFGALVALANLGTGIAIPAMTNTLLSAGDRAHANTAAAALNANRQVGALLGVAVVGVVLHGARDWTVALPVALGLLAAAYAAATAFAWREHVRPAVETTASAAAAEC
jgi:DHA2 family methylenomycin A resistance protein-like MFS transporter